MRFCPTKIPVVQHVPNFDWQTRNLHHRSERLSTAQSNHTHPIFRIVIPELYFRYLYWIQPVATQATRNVSSELDDLTRLPVVTEANEAEIEGEPAAHLPTEGIDQTRIRLQSSKPGSEKNGS